MTRRKPLTVAVDLDGVLRDRVTHRPLEGAQSWVMDLCSRFDVVCFTTRGRTELGRQDVGTWLSVNGFPPLRVTALKLPQFALIIDDRGCRKEPGRFPSLVEIAELL